MRQTRWIRSSYLAPPLGLLVLAPLALADGGDVNDLPDYDASILTLRADLRF